MRNQKLPRCRVICKIQGVEPKLSNAAMAMWECAERLREGKGKNGKDAVHKSARFPASRLEGCSNVVRRHRRREAAPASGCGPGR